MFQWNRHSEEHRRISSVPAQFLEKDVSRPALWTSRLFVFFSGLRLKALRRLSSKQFGSGSCILLCHPKLYTAEEVGPEPVHPNRILIGQEAFNASRIQNALRQERRWQVSELA